MTLNLPQDAMRRRQLDQARDCKRRRREARKILASDKPLCQYGRTKLCLSEARIDGLCHHHYKMETR